MSPMKVTFLGTGTSQGVPMINCSCKVCNSTDTRDQRLRVSVHIEVAGKSIIIDSGPDFRQQVLREKISQLDAILYTHEHKDHVAGLDDVRGFNFSQKKPMPLYLHNNVLVQLKKEFYYCFEENPYPGIPQLAIHIIDEMPFEIQGIKIIPIKAKHLKMDVLGFRIGDFTYLTDANFIEDKEIEKIKGSKYFVINALRKQEHISHFNLEQALEIVRKVQPEKAYLTHISHQLGLYQEIENELPKNVHLAYDGLKLKI